MPINHFSSEYPKTHWWTLQPPPPPNMEQTPRTPSSKPQPNNLWDNSTLHHHRVTTTASTNCGQNTHFSFNLNQEDNNQDSEIVDERETPLTEQEEEREPMFEKPLTPSDVGKLNRLVIPKQNAEKYFPLGGGGDSVDKGLLLSFEDESGKSWRFRYSYWNSSQSYVLTKGWSRFVKEKRLDAGDVVLFERDRADGGRFFIGWRRRTAATAPAQDSRVAQPVAVAPSGGGGWTRVYYCEQPSYPAHPTTLPYQPDCPHAGSVVQSQTTPSNANSKRLRLFGVNLECQLDESDPPTTPDGSYFMPSHGQLNYHFDPHASNHHNHMDVNFSRDINHMRYRQG